MFILNRPARMVGAGIGFAKEYSADRKANKATSETPEHESDKADDGSEEDSHAWAQAIDEAQMEVQPRSANANDAHFNEDSLTRFLERHPPPPYKQQQPVGNLAMPVILPQRRPHSRTRGWVRGYAPVLADAGVDQAAWVEFLDQFEESLNNNNVFWAANAAVWVSDKVYLVSMSSSI